MALSCLSGDTAARWRCLVSLAISLPVQSDAEFHTEICKVPFFQLTPDDAGIIGKIDQTEFEGFEYVNPLLMSAEDVV